MSRQLGICASCHQERPLAAAGVCSRCYELTKPKITCLDCGQERRACKHLPEGVLCARCWGWRNAVACSRCGNVRPRANALSADPLCPACWTAARPHVTCSSCGRTRPPGGVTGEGEPLCTRCSVLRRAPVTCVRCQQLRPPHQRAPGGDGYLCGTCATNNRPDEICGGCGRTAPVVERAGDGSARCARCWAKDHREPCAGCGRLRHPRVPASGRIAPVPRMRAAARHARALRNMRPGRLVGHQERRRISSLPRLLAVTTPAVLPLRHGHARGTALASRAGVRGLR